jgi:hypothetical protein
MYLKVVTLFSEIDQSHLLTLAGYQDWIWKKKRAYVILTSCQEREVSIILLD